MPLTKLKSSRSSLNTSISFPPDLLEKARARAGGLGLSFSAYIQKCLERDLTERGAIVYLEREDDQAWSLAENPATKRSPQKS